MRHLSLLLSILCGVVLGSCTRPADPVDPNDVVMFIYDFGSSAPAPPDAPPGGVAFALWRNGEYALSERFPKHGVLHSGRMDPAIAKALRDSAAFALATCKDESLLFVDSHDFRLGLSDGNGLRRLTAPYLAVSEDPGYPVTSCVHLLRQLLKQVQVSASPSAPIDQRMHADLERWFGADGKAFR